jgi:hypothetical protein
MTGAFGTDCPAAVWRNEQLVENQKAVFDVLESNRRGLLAGLSRQRPFVLDVDGQRIEGRWVEYLRDKPQPNLLCPLCGSRRHRLYQHEGTFKCRRCAGYEHASRHRNRWIPPRLTQLRRSLGASTTPFTPLPPRRRRTDLRWYVQVVTEIGKLEAQLAAKLRDNANDLERRHKRNG